MSQEIFVLRPILLLFDILKEQEDSQDRTRVFLGALFEIGLTLLCQYYGLPFHTTNVTYVNFIQLNVDSERQVFEKLFHGRFIYFQRFFQKSAERNSPKKYFFIFLFNTWPGIRTLALRLITQHITYWTTAKSTTVYLISMFLPEIGWEKDNCQRKIFFTFRFNAWPGDTVPTRLRRL